MSKDGNSRSIQGPGPDERLPEVVLRHLNSEYRRPVADHNRRAFEWVVRNLPSGAPIVVDAGCGTGVSTLTLADRHPDAWLVGIDKSAARMARGVGLDPDAVGVGRGRSLWVRADVVDWWRLADAAGWRLEHHYLLYPNPWPKRAYLKRRWHGHPIFPSILRISRAMTLRTNWRTYAAEFSLALELAKRKPTVVELTADDANLSPFEAKYRASGHALFEVRI